MSLDCVGVRIRVTHGQVSDPDNEASRWSEWLAERLPASDRGQLGWAASWFFALLFGYYQLRPLREAKGFARGSEEIPILFLASFLVMLVAVPFYGWVASRGGGLRLIRRVYRFFEVNLLIFFALMQIDNESVAAWVGRAYFVWLSVFNQFVISMMWTAFAEAYRSKQAKRWFGLISAGGTLGGIIGSIVAGFISSRLDVSFVLLIGVLVLEWCLWCGSRFQQSTTIRNQDALQGPPQTESQSHHASDDTTNHDVEPKPTARRRIWSGVVAIARTPYLLGIAGFLLAINACAPRFTANRATWSRRRPSASRNGCSCLPASILGFWA
ncbi:MAG: hypothetical protein AAF670_02740 [Planctomycetota bacterium]